MVGLPGIVRVVGERVVLSRGSQTLVVGLDSDEVTVTVGRSATSELRRVDQSIPVLLRAVTRFAVASPDALDRLVGIVAAKRGVAVPPGPLAHRLVRLTHPLLLGEPHLAQPALPLRLPAWLEPAFRTRDPRAAAELLFDGRVTRPVVRALCELLAANDPIDLFVLSVAVAVQGQQQPDQLARTLQLRGVGDPRALSEDQATTVGNVLVGLSKTRLEQRLAEVVADPNHRTRARFIGNRWTPSHPRLSEVNGWSELAMRVAVSPGQARHEEDDAVGLRTAG